MNSHLYLLVVIPKPSLLMFVSAYLVEMNVKPDHDDTPVRIGEHAARP